jgi:signal transduction histidine kinase
MSNARVQMLLVEDSVDDASLLVRALQRDGLLLNYARVDTAETMRAALEQQHWDVIISDYSMPQFNGLRALEIAQQSAPQTPFIVVSGSIGEEEAVRLMRYGVSDYLLKDRLSRLGQAVRSVLEDQRLRQEHDAAMAALDENQQRFQAFANALPDLAYILDENGMFVEVISRENPLLPEPAAAMIGKTLFDYYDDDTAERLLATVQRSIYEPERDRTVEYTSTIYGQHYWFEGRAVPMQYTAADGTHLVAWISRDISALKLQAQAEQEKVRLQAQLEQEQKLRAIKSRFFAMLAHDIRNPLAAIKMALTTLQRYADRLDAETRNVKFERIHQQIDLIGDLIEDMLLIEHVESRNVEVQQTETDMVKFITEQTTELRAMFGKTHHLLWAASAESVMVRIDRRLIQRVLMNLVSNAVKYSQEGNTVWVELDVTPGDAVISVRDNGIGIPEEDQPRLFEAFSRASNVGNRQGTGLGLAFVREAVELHGGTVSFVSQLDEGSTFTFSLPRVVELTTEPRS